MILIVQDLKYKCCFKKSHQGILNKLCPVGIAGSVLSILILFLQWTVVGVNWLTLCQECRRFVFRASYCYFCTSWSFLPSRRISRSECRWLHFVICNATHAGSGVRVAVAESVKRDLFKVGEWCNLFGMKLNSCKTKFTLSPRNAQCIPSHPLWLLAELCLRSLMTLIYREWHLIPRWLWTSSLGFQSRL